MALTATALLKVLDKRRSASRGVIHVANSSAVTLVASSAIPAPVGLRWENAGETRRSAALVGWPSYPLHR